MAHPTEGHTVRRYDGELNNLHMLSLEMGGLVLNQTQEALDALLHKDLQRATRVIERDHEVNRLELRIDAEVTSVIARRGPMAQDLRTIMAVSKAVTDMERIGDEAAKIAGVVLNIYDNERADPSVHLLRDVTHMGRLAVEMLRDSLEVLDRLDAGKAEDVIASQSEMGLEFQATFRRLVTYIMEDYRNLGHAINVVLISKALERIGDHAKNIAEYVIYLIRGTDIRHRDEELRGEPGISVPSRSDDGYDDD